MGKKDYVCVPRDEYDALIECKLHINALYDFITKEHIENITLHGCKRSITDMQTIELVSGYLDNDAYFEKLKRDFEERLRKKCE